MGRHHGNAHAERGREDSFAVGNLELRDFITDAFGTVSRDVEVGARHNHAEDVIGVAARDVFATDVARQALSEFPEELFHGVAALSVLHGRDCIGVKHHDANGRLVAHGSSDFAAERLFHITFVKKTGQHVADAVLFKAYAEVLVRHVKSKRGGDNAHLGLPVFLGFGFRELIDLECQNAEVFFKAFDRGANGNALRAMVQVRTTARDFRRAIVSHDDVAGIEACAFSWEHGLVADDVWTKAENLREFSLHAAVHIKHARSFGEEFRQELLHGVDDFGKRTVAQNTDLKAVPGFEREPDLEGGSIELLDGGGHGLLFEGFGGGDCTRRERVLLFFLEADRHELCILGLWLVQHLVKIVFDGFNLPAADGIKNEAEHCAPSSDKYELRPDGHGFFGDYICSNNAHQKGDQPKDIFNDIHTINNIKILQGRQLRQMQVNLMQ